MFGAVPVPGGFAMKSPGIINLNAARYIVLRCEELEDHLFGSYAYGEFNPGIGMLRFFEVNGISHQRVEYINFAKKPFHPLGKLDKLTLSFLLPDMSTPYDFKGCDHLLILSIKYYVPLQKNKIERSVLNPNYDPNFRQYFNQYIDFKDDADRREDERGELDARQIEKLEAMYNYSTSCESSECNGEDNEDDESIDIDDWRR
jgi:hypothetical protein